MFDLIAVAVGLLVATLVSVIATAANSGLALPGAAVIVTVYSAARRDVFGALLTALVVGVVGGASMGDARGVVLLSLLFVIGATRWARVALPLHRRAVLLAWTAAAKVVFDVGMVALGLLLLPGLPLWPALVRVTPLSALLTAAVAFPTFLLLDRIEPLLRARQERSTLFGL